MLNERDIFEKNYDLYVNLVMVRRDVNQYKANRIFNLCIRSYLTDDQAHMMSTELSHYMIGEHTSDEFGNFLRALLFEVRRSIDIHNG